MSGPQILVFVTGVLVLGFILRLVRRRELRGKYSLLWLAVGISVLFAGFLVARLTGADLGDSLRAGAAQAAACLGGPHLAGDLGGLN